MQIVFLSHELPAGAAAEQVRRLAERHDVTVGITGARPAGEARIGSARVLDADEAIGNRADVAVALDWRATTRLFDVEANRHVFWVDSLAFEALGERDGDLLVATLAYDLPVDFLAAAPWVADALGAHRPGARVVLARSGYMPVARNAGAGKLRVYAADAAGRAALGRMSQPYEAVDAIEDADVTVDLDPVDGVLERQLGAAAAGIVTVVLPVGGQSDLVTHMESGIVGMHEDTLGIARDLDRLSADRELLARLSDGARAVAASWPDWDAASKELESALREIVKHDPPRDTLWPRRLMADAVAISTVRHIEERKLQRSLGDAKVAGSPIRKSVRAIKASRKLTPVRKAASRYVPSKLKNLG